MRYAAPIIAVVLVHCLVVYTTELEVVDVLLLQLKGFGLLAGFIGGYVIGIWLGKQITDRYYP